MSGGWQDQYAAAFGGINYIEFSKKKNIVTPLAIDGEIVDELQQSLILCDTGILHESGDIHLDLEEPYGKARHPVSGGRKRENY